tara:strand:- start:2276 stop:2458 length:183 start_codon:yes stop_codon:yes gene_type:complete
MTLKARVSRLESKTLTNYACMEEIPTHVLEALVQRAYRKGNHTPEEAELYRLLEENGFGF